MPRHDLGVLGPLPLPGPLHLHLAAGGEGHVARRIQGQGPHAGVEHEHVARRKHERLRVLNSVAPLPRRPPLPRHALAARPRVHVLREEGEGVLGHLAVAGGVVEQERAFAARVEDLEDGDGVVELRVHVVAGPVARVVERIPRFPRLPFFGGILKGEPRTWVTPLFQEGSHGVT